MTKEPIAYGDPLTVPFWQAARDHRLVLQRCVNCGQYQFPPRPFCLDCEDGEVEWVESKGFGEIYALTTVRFEVLPDLPPPYSVAIVQLDEGPRMLAGIAGGRGAIGERVEIRWLDRAELPPLAMFETVR